MREHGAGMVVTWSCTTCISATACDGATGAVVHGLSGSGGRPWGRSHGYVVLGVRSLLQMQKL